MGHVFGKIPEAVTAAEKHFQRVMKILIDELSHIGDYIIGEKFSAADITFIHCVNWAESIGWGELWKSEVNDPQTKHFRDYIDRCRARPASIRAEAKKIQEIS